jgi:hypothetical protein
MTNNLWGKVDLARLNAFGENYRGNRGQAELARDIAIATGELRVNMQRFPDVFVRGGMKTRGWTKVMIDWRRYLYLDQLGRSRGFWDAYRGEDGYDAFTKTYFGGYSQCAWQAVTVLLSKEDFTELGWGRVKRGKIKMVR